MKKIHYITAVVFTLVISAFSFNYFLRSESLKTEPLENEKNIFNEETKYENVFVHTIEQQGLNQQLLLHVSYPVTENEKINKKVAEVSEEYVHNFESIATDIKAYVKTAEQTGAATSSTIHAEFLQHFDVSFANDNYIAFIFERTTNTGNTGSEDIFTMIFSRSSGKEITMAELFTTKDYLKRLSDLSRQILLTEMEKDIVSLDEKIIEQQREIRKEAIFSGTEPKAENFDSFDFTEDGTLKIIFDKYQVAAGYLGTVEVDIPLDKLSDILEPKIWDVLKITKPTESEPEINTESNGQVKNTTPIKFDGANITDCSIVKCIALTFDDGPSVFTPGLLDILEQKKIRATFFVLGQSANIQRSTIKRMAKDGYVIGNHTWNHKDLRNLDAEGIHSQIDRTNAIIKEITGQPTQLVRPPYGAINQLVKSTIDAPLILWNIDPNDWKDRDTNLVAERIISGAQPGAIILSHDIYQTTVDAIPRIIDELQAQGYQFVTIPDLFDDGVLMPGRTYRSR